LAISDYYAIYKAAAIRIWLVRRPQVERWLLGPWKARRGVVQLNQPAGS
jgi:hypothetical protein